MYQLAAIFGLYGAYKAYKWVFPTHLSRNARTEIRRVLDIESDEDFLRAALSPRAEAATSYARKFRRQKDLQGWNGEGYVYVARVGIHPERVPARQHLRTTEKLLRDFVDRLCEASREKLYKVGYTRRTTGARMNELNSGDRNVCGSVYWPYNFEHVWSDVVRNCSVVEQEAHSILSDCRIANEIFYVTEQDAIDAIVSAKNCRRNSKW